jgi:hypothetical protein
MLSNIGHCGRPLAGRLLCICVAHLTGVWPCEFCIERVRPVGIVLCPFTIVLGAQLLKHDGICSDFGAAFSGHRIVARLFVRPCSEMNPVV